MFIQAALWLLFLSPKLSAAKHWYFTFVQLYGAEHQFFLLMVKQYFCSVNHFAVHSTKKCAERREQWRREEFVEPERVTCVLQCVVIGLQSTGEARTMDIVEEQGTDLTDFVSTAK